MNNRDIEHMWKVASNNPNHDTNWHDPVVIAFANLVAAQEREAWEQKFSRLQNLMDIRETQPNKPCCLAARADERDECAKTTGEFARKWWSIHCDTNKHMETTRKAHDDFCALQAAIKTRGTT
jgi:hypothetical protein